MLWDRIITDWSIDSGTKNLKIKWQDERETVVKNIPKEPRCSKCDSKFVNLGEYVQYHGLCRPCFAESAFLVPGKLKDNNGLGSPVFKRPILVTYSPGGIDSEEADGADFFGNDFGLGDLVLHKPEKRRSKVSTTEGIITGLFEYWRDNLGQQKSYLTRVLFKGSSGSQLIVSKELEALTCNALELDLTDLQDRLDNVEIKFNPEASESRYMRGVFRDAIARAIWMSYRLDHQCTAEDNEDLAVKSLEVTKELSEIRLSEEKVHLAFKKSFNLSAPYRFKMGDRQIAALVPYLTGEKTADYSIIDPNEPAQKID